MVTAAFIGPGTLTVCTLAGVQSGYGLLWVLVFAIFTTIILQEMAARLGLITQKGLGEVFRSLISHPAARWALSILVILGILMGNAAYQAGNLAGAGLGLELLGDVGIPWALIVGVLAFFLLWFGQMKQMHHLLIVLVLVMSVVFVCTAIIVRPSFSAVLSGLLIPRMSAHQQLMVLSLLGTTIVPYNLFLHASAVSSKWKHPEELNGLRTENRVAILIGGVISVAIVITSATAWSGENQQVNGVADMAVQLEPLLGAWSSAFLAAGLFAAGISSSLTAPLAAAYAAKGIFGWKSEKGWAFRLTWMAVLLSGIIVSVSAYRPVAIIQTAQMANGLLLPVVAVLLIYACNQRKLMDKYVNRTFQNILSVLVVGVCILLGVRSFHRVFDFL